MYLSIWGGLRNVVAKVPDCDIVESKIELQSRCYIYVSIYLVGGPRNVVAKVPDCDIVESKIELQSRNCVHFQTNTF